MEVRVDDNGFIVYDKEFGICFEVCDKLLLK